MCAFEVGPQRVEWTPISRTHHENLTRYLWLAAKLLVILLVLACPEKQP